MTGRREERRDDRQLGRPGGGGNHYQMRQKMVAIGDDFWIENDNGQKVFKVDGKALPRAPDPRLRRRARQRAVQDPGAHAARERQHGGRRTARRSSSVW